MTIQEAIRSGKPFKRRYSNVIRRIEGGVAVMELVATGNDIIPRTWRPDMERFSLHDILADDWEIKE
jgi:hypothetical protein